MRAPNIERAREPDQWREDRTCVQVFTSSSMEHRLQLARVGGLIFRAAGGRVCVCVCVGGVWAEANKNLVLRVPKQGTLIKLLSSYLHAPRLPN